MANSHRPLGCHSRLSLVRIRAPLKTTLRLLLRLLLPTAVFRFLAGCLLLLLLWSMIVWSSRGGEVPDSLPRVCMYL